MLNNFNKILISTIFYNIVFFMVGSIIFGKGVSDWPQRGITIYFCTLIYTIINLLIMEEEERGEGNLRRVRVIFIGTIFIALFIQVLINLI